MHIYIYTHNRYSDGTHVSSVMDMLTSDMMYTVMRTISVAMNTRGTIPTYDFNARVASAVRKRIEGGGGRGVEHEPAMTNEIG